MTFIPFGDDAIAQQERFLDDITKLVGEFQQDKHNPEELIRKLKYNVPMIGVFLQVLFTTTVYHMKTINRLYSVLEDLPNNKEFDNIKQELEKQKKDTINTLLPIKQPSQSLEESKNKKVDYIG